MKISAKDILKLLAQQDDDDGEGWNPTEEELQQMIDEGVGLEPTTENMLWRQYDMLGQPSRMTIIDPEGNLYSVFVADEELEKIAIQPIEMVMRYSDQVDLFNSWAEANKGAPQGWMVYDPDALKAEGSTKGKSFLVISNSNGELQLLRVKDERSE